MTKPIQAVRRCVDVLLALNAANGSTVSQIAREVGLSRGTVFRMLETLTLDELVAKDPADNTYWLTAKVQSLSGGYRDERWVVEIAKPALESLAAEILWPVSVQRLDRGAMYVRASTDSQSPFALWHSTVGARVDFFESAGGALYLAHATLAQRRAILAYVSTFNSAPTIRRDTATVPPTAADLARIRTDGYNVARKIIDSTVAVPIVVDGRIFACLTARFLNRSLTQAQFLRAFLPVLQRSAASIGETLGASAAET